MNRYQLLVLDVDGTILDKQGRITDADKTAIAKAMATGVKVSLSTGRALEACERILDALKLHGFHIFFDGALVYDQETKEEVYAAPLDKNTVKQMAEYLSRIPMNMDFYSTNTYYIERETWATEIRRTFFGLNPVITDFSTLWEKERILKGTLVISSPEEKRTAEKFISLFSDRLRFSRTKTPAYPDVDFINVLSHGVSKGTALKALASHLNISLSAVVAMGDGANDIPLLETAGLAIAMANAPAAVKAVADELAPPAEESGVSAVINKYILSGII